MWNHDPYQFIRERNARERRHRTILAIAIVVLVLGTVLGLRIYGELAGACHDVQATCFEATGTGGSVSVHAGRAYPCTKRVCE